MIDKITRKRSRHAGNGFTAVFKSVFLLVFLVYAYSTASSSCYFTTSTNERHDIRHLRLSATSNTDHEHTLNQRKVDGTYLGQLRTEGSQYATVMAMASGYELNTYKRFVGSLRKTGFEGNIILGVKEPLEKEIKQYFLEQNVTFKYLKLVDCSFGTWSEEEKKEIDGHELERKTCAYPYNDIKLRWSRFPLMRDWLQECETCTGPVLVTDARDVFFQRDPFEKGAPEVTGLQVFQEHKTQTTAHWLTQWPIKDCKGIDFAHAPYKSTMLCSGTTIGTKDAMIAYLNDMHQEMILWMKDPKCWFEMNGDDQSIHNYLFYTNKLQNAISVPNRMGIVNTVGVQGAKILNEHHAHLKAKQGLDESEADEIPFVGAKRNRWIGSGFDLIDDEGYFVDFDGARSRVVHQYE